MEKILSFFNDSGNEQSEEYIDYNHFADLWLQLLVPALDELKSNQKRQSKIYTLGDLTDSSVKLTEENIDWLLENSLYSNTLDEIIAACIIGVTP